MEPICTTLILFGLLALLVYIFLVFNFNYWKKRGIAGPKPKPLLGTLPNVILQKRNFYYDIYDIYNEYKSKESFVGIFNIRDPQLLITDPEVTRDIIVTKFKNFNLNELAQLIDKDVDPLFGQNPFMLQGEAWKEKRAEVTPALTTSRVKASYPVMLAVCEKLTKYLEKKTKNHPVDGFDAKELAAKYTTEVVSNCIYGIESGAFGDDRCEIREMGAAILANSVGAFIYNTIIAMLPKPLQFYKWPFVQKETQHFFEDLMRKAIELRKQNQSDRTDFLNYLLQLQEKKNLSNFDMTAHTMTFFIDGFETSSIVISNCFRLLSQHKDVQEKLREKIKRASAENGEISYEQLLELPYLDQVINETMRLFTPAPLINKVCTETCELVSRKDRRVKIEKGTVVVLPYHFLQNDPNYWENPEKFDPERFSPENGGVRKYKDMGVFLPFGDGPRMCLGMKFALCQSKAAIVELIKNWDITINSKTPAKFVWRLNDFLANPEGGTWIDIKRVVN